MSMFHGSKRMPTPPTSVFDKVERIFGAKVVEYNGQRDEYLLDDGRRIASDVVQRAIDMQIGSGVFGPMVALGGHGHGVIGGGGGGGGGGYASSGVAGKTNTPDYDINKPSHRLQMLEWRLREGLSSMFKDIHTTQCLGKIYLTVTTETGVAHLDDDEAMFPSDTLITQLRLLAK